MKLRRIIWLFILLLSFSYSHFEIPFRVHDERLDVFDDPNPDPLIYGLGVANQFFITLPLGMPHHYFNFTVDTFVRESWIITDYCKHCNFTHKFWPKESHTYQTNNTKTSIKVFT